MSSRASRETHAWHAFALSTAIMAAVVAAPATAQQTTTAEGNSKLDAIPSDLQKVDVKQGTGAEALSGRTVVVHYTGWLYDAKKANKGFQGKQYATCHWRKHRGL